MSEKKINLKRILAVAGCGAALAGALFWASVAEERSNGQIARVMSENMSTFLVRDTIDIRDTDDYTIVRFGEYNMFDDKITSHHFNDVTTTTQGHKDVEKINDHARYNCYHELRHAMNVRLQAHYKGLVTREFYVADEISAIIAGYLSEISEVVPLKEGEILPHVSYKLKPKYNLIDVANKVFCLALEDMVYKPSTYQDLFIGNESLAEYRLMLPPFINKKTLINEMMTFEINGKSENLLNLASKDVRNDVYKYIDSYKQR